MTEVTIGDCRLIHGDCRDYLPTLGKFDLLLTDPPYGIGAGSAAFKNGTRKSAVEYVYGDWDESTPSRELVEEATKAAGSAIIWGGNYFVLPPSKCWLVWDKCTGDNSYADAELAWANINSPVRLIRKPWVGANAKDTPARLHPTQKPVAVMAWCLDQVPDAKTVLDCFMGSGTTGVACAQSGRSFTGIERERKYFDIACERIDRAQAQGQLLPPEPVAAPEQQTMEL